MVDFNICQVNLLPLMPEVTIGQDCYDYAQASPDHVYNTLSLSTTVVSDTAHKSDEIMAVVYWIFMFYVEVLFLCFMFMFYVHV